MWNELFSFSLQHNCLTLFNRLPLLPATTCLLAGAHLTSCDKSHSIHLVPLTSFTSSLVFSLSFSIRSDSANDGEDNSVNTDVPRTASSDDVNSSPLSPSSEHLVWCVGSFV